MPLVAHNSLPTFHKLREDGFEILQADHAIHQDIRELHIGLLNMMPDKALKATERQFMRMITSCNKIAQFYIHPFSIEGIERSSQAKTYINQYYQSFSDIKKLGLDALIITGANPSKSHLAQEEFWPGVIDVFKWANKNVVSTLCSCLASHAAFKQFYNIERQLLPEKLWGVYSHRIIKPDHPLVSNINTRFDVPHSRYNEVTKTQLENAGLNVLVESKIAGVHLAVSEDLFRTVYFQGHPEYNVNSLLKEYKREVFRFFDNDRLDYPAPPENYFNTDALIVLDSFAELVKKAKQSHSDMPRFPEDELNNHLDNTWLDTGKAIFNNWLGLVYQLTHVDRNKVFMRHIDPNDPLNMKGSE